MKLGRVGTSIWFVFSILIFTGISPSASMASASTSPTLGLSVSVLPQANGEIAPIQAGQINSLALTIMPGQQAIRSVRVQSASPNIESIALSIGHASVINSVLTLDDTQVSEISPWIAFSANSLQLKGDTTADVDLTISVPNSEPIGIRQAYLLIKATLPSHGTNQNTARQGAARYAIPIYIGVGTTAQIVTDFSVGLVTLVHTKDGEAFALTLKNIGMTPVLPVGFLQLSSTLEKLVFAAQIPFGGDLIQAGHSETLTVEVPLEVPDAIWNVHAEAHDGTLLATSDSIVTLKRHGIIGQNQIAIYRILLGAVSFVLFGAAWMYIRSTGGFRRFKQ